MPVLANGRQERFARLIAAGATPVTAYRMAGYRATGAARVKALLERSAVAARIVELGRAWDPDGDAESLDASRERRPGRGWVVARLVETAERALQAVPVTDRKGAPTGEFTYQGAVALKALELLGRELGMFGDRKERSAGAPGAEVEGLSDEDLERRAARLAETLGIGRMGDGS